MLFQKCVYRMFEYVCELNLNSQLKNKYMEPRQLKTVYLIALFLDSNSRCFTL